MQHSYAYKVFYCKCDNGDNAGQQHLCGNTASNALECFELLSQEPHNVDSQCWAGGGTSMTCGTYHGNKIVILNPNGNEHLCEESVVNEYGYTEVDGMDLNTYVWCGLQSQGGEVGADPSHTNTDGTKASGDDLQNQLDSQWQYK